MDDEVTFQQKARRFITQCLRVLRVTKKPDRKEYMMLVKVTSLGIAIIGMIGFLLFMAERFIGL